MHVIRLNAFQNYYAFSTDKFGLYIVEINLQTNTVIPKHQHLQSRSVRTAFEFKKGKLLCGLTSQNELWVVDYLSSTDLKLCDTYGPVLSIQPFTDINKRLKSLILVLEKDWVCILNIECCLYVRVMRIPIWFNESLPSH